LDILHLAAHCCNVPVTFTLELTVSDFAIYSAAAVLLGVPCLLLGLSIRHFVPLLGGLNVPWWAQALGPFLFASDRFFSEAARPHRKPFVGYSLAFAVWCALLVAFGVSR